MKTTIADPEDNDEEQEYQHSGSVKAIANNEAMIEMEHQREITRGKPKVCSKCMRINPPDRETCLTCGALLKDALKVELDLEKSKQINWGRRVR